MNWRERAADRFIRTWEKIDTAAGILGLMAPTFTAFYIATRILLEWG